MSHHLKKYNYSASIASIPVWFLLSTINPCNLAFYNLGLTRVDEFLRKNDRLLKAGFNESKGCYWAM